MGTLIKQSAPVVIADKGGSGSSNTVGNSGYIPTGVLIAMILKALRDAQDNDMERQQMQAKAEQAFDQALGNCGGDPTKGVIAMAAQSVIDAGNEQRKGLIAMGVSSAVNAGVSGGMAVGALSFGAYQTRKSGGGNDVESQLKTLKANRDILEAPQNEADIQLANKGINVDPDLPNQKLDLYKKMDDDEVAAKVAQVKGEPEELAELKEKINREIKDKESEVGEHKRKIDQYINLTQTIGNISNASTQAAGSIQKAPHDAAAASENAQADVTKTLQQIDSTSANNFRDNAHAAAQQALKIADDLAQVAAAQVQMRG